MGKIIKLIRLKEILRRVRIFHRPISSRAAIRELM